MKCRNGFVSNSSSSSFMFAIPKSYNGKIKLTLNVDLKELGHICKTKEDLTKWFLENDGYGDRSLKELFEECPYLEKNYKEGLKQLEAGKVIAVGTVSNEGSDVEYILTENNWRIDDTNVKQIGEIGW